MLKFGSGNYFKRSNFQIWNGIQILEPPIELSTSHIPRHCSYVTLEQH